jgi:peptidyl-prolyl cis-trans isomerase SurA
MKMRCDNPGWAIAAIFLALAPGCFARTGFAQQPAAAPAPQGVLVDQVIAVVNGDLILESDVDAEHRAEAFQPLHDADGETTREAIVSRLIDRDLILQQSKLQPDDRVTRDQARAELKKIAKEIPACRQFHCETAAGWQKFVEAQGFTVPEIEERERQKMEILKYIELRFRAGIHITPQQIKDYYDHTLLPKEAKLKAAPPPLEPVSEQIEGILLEQQVSNLLEDWLTSLKAQGNVRMMKPGEDVP